VKPSCLSDFFYCPVVSPSLLGFFPVQLHQNPRPWFFSPLMTFPRCACAFCSIPLSGEKGFWFLSFTYPAPSASLSHPRPASAASKALVDRLFRCRPPSFSSFLPLQDPPSHDPPTFSTAVALHPMFISLFPSPLHSCFLFCICFFLPRTPAFLLFFFAHQVQTSRIFHFQFHLFPLVVVPRPNRL